MPEGDRTRDDEAIVLTHARLRRWRMDDVLALARHANNRNVSRNLGDVFPFPYTEDDARAFIAGRVDEAPLTHFAIEVDGEAAGGISFQLGDDIYRRNARMGYWLAEPHWGRGIMSEAARVVAEYALGTFDVRRVEAGVFEYNPASGRVLEKAGFVLEGRLRSRLTKDGETFDELLYALMRKG